MKPFIEPVIETGKDIDAGTQRLKAVDTIYKKLYGQGKKKPLAFMLANEERTETV